MAWRTMYYFLSMSCCTSAPTKARRRKEGAKAQRRNMMFTPLSERYDGMIFVEGLWLDVFVERVIINLCGLVP